MKSSDNVIKAIEHFEGCFLDSYLCPRGIWTIGLGTTRYESGAEVKQGEHIIKERAYELMHHDLHQFEFYLNKNILVPLLQHQFDALIIFMYNIGVTQFLDSTAYKKVCIDPFDKRIPEYIQRFRYSGDGTKNGIDDDEDGLIDEAGEKKRMAGLIRRRKCEAHLYVTGEIKFFEDEI